MRIYVASRTRHAAMWREIRQGGVDIISSWIDKEIVPDFVDLWKCIQVEVSGADRLVVFVEADDFPLKGALVEVGIAIQARVPIYLVLDPDIKLEGATSRPIGSWIEHPGVHRVPTLYDAFQATS